MDLRIWLAIHQTFPKNLIVMERVIRSARKSERWLVTLAQYSASRLGFTTVLRHGDAIQSEVCGRQHGRGHGFGKSNPVKI